MTAKARITAIDRFIKGCREDGIYDDLNACCVMAGWDSLAGALTPLKGSAPTNSGFIATDYDRGGIGITGDGTSYLNSGRASDDDPQNDSHWSVYPTALGTPARALIHTDYFAANQDVSGFLFNQSPSTSVIRSRIGEVTGTPQQLVKTYEPSNLIAASRASGTEFTRRYNGISEPVAASSATPQAANYFVFARQNGAGVELVSNATIAFYSIGSSLGSDPATGLAALDARVSTLMADLRAIEETGFDKDAIGYLRAVEEADGALLETSVKIAVNNLVSGLKADGLWNAIGSSCLLCGPRTLAGALVPLKGDAPTAYGFVDGDYDREGLAGDGTSYLDSGRANDADPQDDKHVAVYVKIPTDLDSLLFPLGTSSNGSTPGVTQLLVNGLSDNAIARINGVSNVQLPYTYNQFSLFGASRPDSATLNLRVSGSETSGASDSQTPGADPILLFGVGSGFLGGEIAYYSIGSHVDDLAALESHVSAYVTAIGAAV